MIKNPDYNKATNAAYEALTNYNGGFPRINIFKIINSFKNIRMCTFSNIAKKYCLSIEDFVSEISPSEYGFTIFNKVKPQYLICYNDLKPDTTIRFTTAHELGHIILGHEEDGEIEDKEANCFARNILCPVPIRDELKLLTTDDYCSAFEISPRAAQVAINLKQSDSYYISKDYYDMVNDKAYCYFNGCTLSELYCYC